MLLTVLYRGMYVNLLGLVSLSLYLHLFTKQRVSVSAGIHRSFQRANAFYYCHTWNQVLYAC